MKFAPIPLLLLALYGALFSAGAEAGFLERCQQWFSRADRPSLSEADLGEWRKSFGPGGSHPFLSGMGVGQRADLFWHFYGRLAPSVRERLEALPLTQRDAFAEMHRLTGGGFPQSFLDQILKRASGENLKEGFSAFRRRLAEDPGLGLRLDAEADELVRVSRLQSAWVHQEVGAVDLPVIVKGKKQYLVVNGMELEASFAGGEWTVLVPKYLMKHAYWNPTSPEKVIQMARAGVKPPKKYSVGIGHDGYFYPDDGNHRLDLDVRKLIPVKISAPPRTLSLRNMFDYVGIPQPPQEKILAYMEGKISWEELVPSEEARKQFTLVPGAPPSKIK